MGYNLFEYLRDEFEAAVASTNHYFRAGELADNCEQYGRAQAYADALTQLGHHVSVGADWVDELVRITFVTVNGVRIFGGKR